MSDDPSQEPADYLDQGTHDRVHHRRWSQIAVGLVAVVVVVAGGVTLLKTLNAPEPAGAAKSDQGSQGSEGPLSAAGAASCTESYSPDAVAARGFAFDGTVTHIGPARSNQAGSEHLDLAGVTFAVNEWFHGGSGSVVTIDMPRTSRSISESISQPPPSYGVGTRLLVSGEPRWGGVPLADAIAWGCGFTRYYDAQSASEWRTAEAG